MAPLQAASWRARVEAALTRSWWRPAPDALAWLLWPLTRVYLLLWHLTQRALPARQPVPVVVVGNLVVGGAGKTPAVIALVQALQARGWTPGVVSRGYGRQGDALRAVAAGDDASEVGDEPLLVARRTSAPVWVGRDRSAAVTALCQAHPQVDVVVSDDGLHHRALARQAEWVVFDERGVGNGLLLPAGPLRCPLPSALGPGTQVLYTAGIASTALPGALARRRLGAAWPLAAWHAGDATQALPLQALRGRPLLAAAGLAAPEKFFAMLRAEGLDIATLPLPDHHRFDTLPWAPDTPEVLVTEKDAVKLAPEGAGATRVWVVPLDLSVPPAVIDALVACLPPLRRPSTPARLPHP